MKRKGYLYDNICKIENIQNAFNEVCRNTKNKRRVETCKEYKCLYISKIHNILKNKQYSPGPTNVFIIYEPKERKIVSQNMQEYMHLFHNNYKNSPLYNILNYLGEFFLCFLPLLKYSYLKFLVLADPEACYSTIFLFYFMLI